MIASGGNGWGPASATLETCDGTIIESDLTLEEGSEDTTQICLPLVSLDSGGEVTDVLQFVLIVEGAVEGSIQWELLDPDGFVTMEGSIGTVTTCGACPAVDGVGSSMDLHLVDSFGDGWNGNTLDVFTCDGTVIESGLTLSSGDFAVTDVCLSPSLTTDGLTIIVGGGFYANEVGWTLIDAVGQVVIEGGAPVTVTTCDGCMLTSGVIGYGLELEMYDDFGDGWNGNTLDVYDCSGQLVESGLTMAAGAFGEADVCLPPLAGVHIVVGGGAYVYEVSWAL